MKLGSIVHYFHQSMNIQTAYLILLPLYLSGETFTKLLILTVEIPHKLIQDTIHPISNLNSTLAIWLVLCQFLLFFSILTILKSLPYCSWFSVCTSPLTSQRKEKYEKGSPWPSDYKVYKCTSDHNSSISSLPVQLEEDSSSCLDSSFHPGSGSVSFHNLSSLTTHLFFLLSTSLPLSFISEDLDGYCLFLKNKMPNTNNQPTIHSLQLFILSIPSSPSSKFLLSFIAKHFERTAYITFLIILISHSFLHPQSGFPS